MRPSIRWAQKALSPYAQALRQVALKGSVALGPSAKEMDLELYRKGALSADYRPPVQGKWDDTIERWAYAWQFPAEEGEGSSLVASVERNRSGFTRLLTFCEKLAQSPPSATPRSGVDSTHYPMLTSNTADSSVTPLLEQSNTTRDAVTEEVNVVDYDDLASAMEQVQEKTQPAAMMMMPATSFSALTNIPVAYLDDQSERSNAGKELYAVLEEVGLEYTEDGLVVAVSALARQHYIAAARALFDFAASVGLGPSAELYKALMKHAALKGEVNDAMALIEEMKSKGITPAIGNWHELMRSFHNARDYAAVAQIVDNMKMYANLEPNEVTFALQLRALAKDTSQANSLAEAIQLFDQMENVYGFVAARPHYDALMFALSQSPSPEMRLRCEELAQKMDLMGIAWNATTYLNLIRAAQVVGDVEAVEKYLGRMREERIPANILHLSWAVQAHVQHLIRLDYNELKAKGDEAVLSTWMTHMNVCFGLYELLLRRGWEMQLPFLNALLRLCCQTTILCLEHLPAQTTALGKFEEQATRVWRDSFDEWRLTKDAYSYECYIALLAHQQRIDEAEKLFQQMVLQSDMVPSRRTYECLLFMHLSSGEEGGAARALHYLEAMERAGLPIRASLLKKIVRVNDAAGYKRDMKRRARRIMQAREEYLARKAEGVGFNATTSMTTTSEGKDVAGVDAEGQPIPTPLPIAADSALAWWTKWKRDTVSKHELFDEESADGTPKGERFDEKNAALAKLGIESSFPTEASVPGRPQVNALLPALREAEGGAMAGALWALDGGELSYPADGGGPQGWGVRLWRERQVLKKEFQKVLDGKAPVPEFAPLGVASRPAGEQLAVEQSGARTAGELADWRQFAEHRYDDGTAKPPSEMAQPVPSSAELVWRGEQRDALAPYKTDEELALESDNTFYAQLTQEATAKTTAVVQVLKDKAEEMTTVVGRGPTRRSKYDYLAKWREMYRHGTLDVPTAPVLHFGRGAEDHQNTMAATVREWYARNRRSPATEAQLTRWSEEQARTREARTARAALRGGRSRRVGRSGKSRSKSPS